MFDRDGELLGILFLVEAPGRGQRRICAFITKLEPLVRKPQETGPLLWSAEQWGIVRYAAGSGSTPEHDIAAFDGWYADREMATAVYHDWSERYPNLVVALVRGQKVRWAPQ